MSKFDQIQEIIKKLPVAFGVEEVALEDAYNRILRENVVADMDMPPFHKSAMDGYACRLEDIENSLEVLEVIQAGSFPKIIPGKNQCVKIMTGAAVPNGCDCVFKVEDSEEVDSKHVKCTNPKTAKNICYQGEDYQKNEVLIEEGTIINTPQMAVLAGAGYSRVKVTKQPLISVIATGSELVEPARTPKPGQIRNSNTSQLVSQLRQMNLRVVDKLMLADDFELLTATFLKALINSDFVIFTGGASVGDFDFIPEILKEQEFKFYWDNTGIKPGNPMTFSEKKGKYVIGLSGNPVSSLAQFEMIAKPAIYQLMGANYSPLRILGAMAFDFTRKKADRIAVIPVIIDSEGLISEIPFHGSAHINALVSANALLEVPLNINTIKKGDNAHVRPL
ncbi:molybdopterin molybdotransferase MoeA [Maribellus mangrovi]|uniref:molybdopterin molybdotransferase MoeA n=1 Tax=Maribellus mangrovi TaxID=3133146 RepID=UPI0030EE328C